MKYKSRKQVREDIFAMEEVAISAHDDADGIGSGYLLAQVLESAGIEVTLDFPADFGNVSGFTDVVVDQVPIDIENDSIVIDHHPHHSSRRNFEYRLWHEDVPTTLMLYRMFKKEITHPWKLIVGTAGDGQPELTPPEIWDNYPELFLMKASIYSRGSKFSVYRNPMFTMLSSGINAISRAEKNDQMGPVVAYKVLKQVETPIELVYHPMCDKAKGVLKAEVTAVMNKYAPIDIGKVMFWAFETDLNILSRLATTMEAQEKKTIVAVDKTSRKISIRGVHALWVKDKLSEFQIGGHSKWMGGKLDDGQTAEDLLKALVERTR